MNTLTYIILANVIVSLISLIGGVMIIWKNLLTKKVMPYLVAFAAGIIMATAFFDILPEALHEAIKIGKPESIFLPIFLGILFSFFLERFVVWFHHHESTHGLRPTTLLIGIGDGVHNLIDGVAIAATFMSSPALGIATTIAIFAHEIPQELADFGVLIHAGLSNFKALMVNLMSAVTAIAGGVAAYYFLQRLNGALPILLSFSGGIFIYIAGSDLIPHLHENFSKERQWAQTIPFVFGIIIMYVLVLLLEG